MVTIPRTQPDRVPRLGCGDLELHTSYVHVIGDSFFYNTLLAATFMRAALLTFDVVRNRLVMSGYRFESSATSRCQLVDLQRRTSIL